MYLYWSSAWESACFWPWGKIDLEATAVHAVGSFFSWADARLRPIQAIKHAGLIHWLLFLLPPQETKLFCSHLKPFTGRLRMDSGKARVETLCSFAQICKSQWSWKECTSCPCIQSPPLASSHVLWTPRKAWHSRDVPQGWHPHATSSSDCSPAAVLQTFPALPAPQQQLKVPNVQGIGHCVSEAELYTCMWCLHILGLWLGLLKKDFIFNLY